MGKLHNQVKNEYIIFKSYTSLQSAIGRYCCKTGLIKKLQYVDIIPWGISPRNVQQRIALDLLLDPGISLVTMTGRAGTGKTLLALAAALHLTLDEGAYKKILITRLVIPVGKDIGYLPGEKRRKITPLDATYL